MKQILFEILMFVSTVIVGVEDEDIRLPRNPTSVISALLY